MEIKDDASSVKSSTLRFHYSPDMRDSQVSSGWHGKAIAYWNEVERKRKAVEDERKKSLFPMAEDHKLTKAQIVFNVWGLGSQRVCGVVGNRRPSTTC